MPTVAEILKQSGFDDSEIAQLDQRAQVAFNSVLQQAQTEREQAELQKRSVDEFWQNTFNPGVAAWEAEKAQLARKAADAAAEAAFYRARQEELKELGIAPADAPNFTARDGQGRFVAGAPGSTPGSPTFLDPSEVIKRVGDGMNTISTVMWKHQNLYGAPLPISPSELISRADQAGLDPASFAERQFKFSLREQEIQAQRAKEHDDKIRQEEREAARREFAEKAGSNPDMRRGVPSRLADVQRKVDQKAAPDPLLMNENQRRAATVKMIRDQISELDSARG